MRTTISDDAIEAMAHTIQHSENIGSCFINDDEAVERIQDAIKIIGIDYGIEWSISVMRKAVDIQAQKKIFDYETIKVQEDELLNNNSNSIPF